MKFPASYRIVAICTSREDAPESALIKGRAAVLNRLIAAALACITAVESVVGCCQFLLWLELMDEEETRGRGVDGVPVWCRWSQMRPSLIWALLF